MVGTYVCDGCIMCMSQGAKQRLTDLEMKGKSLLQARKIRQFDESFDTKQFAQQALDIYIEAHTLLEEWDLFGFLLMLFVTLLFIMYSSDVSARN